MPAAASACPGARRASGQASRRPDERRVEGYLRAMASDPRDEHPLHDQSERISKDDPTGQTGQPFMVTFFVGLLVAVLAIMLVVGIVVLT